MNPRIWLSCAWWLVCFLLLPNLASAAPYAYITNGGSNTVSVIDTATNAVVASVAVGVGPAGVAVNPTGTRVYVANIVSNNVSVIDTATNAVVATVAVGNSPAGVAVHPAGSWVYVANAGSNNVSVIDATTNAVIATVAVGPSPGGIAVNPAGTPAYVTNTDSNTVSIIDTVSNTVVATVVVTPTVAAGLGPQAAAVNPAGTLVYVTVDSSNSVSIIDAVTNKLVGSVAVESTPGGVAVNPAGSRIYVANGDANNVSVIDAATNTVVAKVPVGTSPAGIGVDPGGSRIYVANFDSNNVSVIDTATNAVVATVAVGSLPVALGSFIGPATVAPPGPPPPGPPAPPSGSNYQGLWWNAPANSEAFWGVNFAHQGDRVFATWYTYDTAGNPWWLSMLAERTSPTSNTYAGTIYQNTGPSFNAFVGSATAFVVGSGTLTFADANNGTFTYTVNGTKQTKSITRYDLGTGSQPTCVYSAAPNVVASQNYQDLWWVPDGKESGWGINFAHQGNSIFATWYTYGTDNKPLWLSALAQRVNNSNVYVGTLYRTSGPRFDAYNAGKAVLQKVGTVAIVFSDGNNAMFSYTANGAGGLPSISAPQEKQITRFPFAAPAGTVCR